jgi:hypothetical protein
VCENPSAVGGVRACVRADTSRELSERKQKGLADGAWRLWRQSRGARARSSSAAVGSS